MEQEVQKQEKPKRKKDILKLVIIGLILAGVVFLIFGAGIIVGEMKAKFSYRWAENYHRIFGGPRGGFLKGWPKFPLGAGDFFEGHGVWGQIIDIKDKSIVIKGKDEMEKVVLLKEDTVIKKGRETLKNGLNVGDFIVVIGSPDNDGRVEAKLIRVFAKEFYLPKKLPLKNSYHEKVI